MNERKKSIECTEASDANGAPAERAAAFAPRWRVEDVQVSYAPPGGGVDAYGDAVLDAVLEGSAPPAPPMPMPGAGGDEVAY